MKKIVLAATVVALFFTGCKKDSADKFKTDLAGRWEISKIEPGTSLPLVIPGDYYDFKSGEDDIVEIRRGGNTQSGTYSPIVGNEINIAIGAKLYNCKVSVLDGNRLEFIAAGDGKTETVYLKR